MENNTIREKGKVETGPTDNKFPNSIGKSH